MKKAVFSVAVLMFIMMGTVLADEIKWYYDIDEALEAAKGQDKIIMVDVYTDWCHWCHELDKRTYTHEGVIKLSKQMINVKINPEKSQSAKEFASKFGVTGYPAIIFLNSDGEEIDRQGGFSEGPAFEQKLKSVINSAKYFGQYKSEFESGNYKNISDYLELLASKSSPKMTLKVLEVVEEEDIDVSDDIMASAHFALVPYFGESEEFEKALKHSQKAANYSDKTTETYFLAKYYEAYSHYLMGNSNDAKKVIESVMNSKHMPANLKSYFDQFYNELK